jgi:sugar phosphate isomerase/epimerase
MPALNKGLTLPDVPAMFADKLGVHNVELWGVHFDDTSLKFCERIRKAAEKVDSNVFNLQIDGVKYSLSDPDRAQRKESIGTVKQWMDRAAALGAKSARANTGGRRGEAFDVKVTADSFRRLAEYGEKIGVKILVENHGGHSTQPENVVAIIETVDSPWCRTLPDFGNIPGGADEAFREKMLKTLFPHALVASAKGMWFNDDGKHQPYDIGRCVRIGEACGFKGIYSAEYWDPSGRPFDPFRVAKLIIDNVLRNL